VLWWVYGASGHPDRRLVTAIHWRRAIGGAGRYRLGADRLFDRRNRRHSPQRLADPRVLDALAFRCLGCRFHGHQPVVRPRLEYPEHDRIPSAARNARRFDGPDHVHLVLLFFSGATPGVFRRSGGHDCLARAGTWSRHRRLDYRYLELALAVLCQPGSRDFCHNPSSIADPNRRARFVAAEGRRLPRDRADGGRPQRARIRVGRGFTLELVRRRDDPQLRPDRSNRRRAVRDPELDFCAAGRRPSGADEPQFRGRLLSFVRHRDWHLLDNLSDPAVSGLCARIQRLADRDSDLLDGRRFAGRGAGVHLACAQIRHALADDARPRLVRSVDVGLQLHHQRLERRRTPGSPAAARLSTGLRGSAGGHSRPWQLVAGAPEICERPVQHDAQSRRCGRHRGVWCHPKRPDQFPLQYDRLASDAGKRPHDEG